MNIGNINRNNINTGVKADISSFAKASDPRDVFVKSSPGEPEPSLKNLAQKFSAKDAGKVLLENSDKMKAIRNQTIDTPKWKTKGGTLFDSDLLYDKQNKCVYGGVEDRSSGRDKYYLTCLNKDGSVRWKFDRGEFKEGPALDNDGNIYFTGDNILYAVDKDGNEKWNIYLDNNDEVKRKPLVSPEGTVFVETMSDEDNNENGIIYAVRDGEVSWKYRTAQRNSRTDSILATKDGSLYIAGKKEVREKKLFKDKITAKNFLIGLRPDGTEKFRVPVEGWPSAYEGNLTEGPDGTIYAVQNDGVLKGYSPDGVEKFSRQITRQGKPAGKGNGFTPSYPPVIDEWGNSYLVLEKGWSGELVRLDKDGNEVWRKDSQDKYTTKPHFLPDGTIAIGMEDEHIHIFDRKGNHLKKFLAGGEERIKRLYGRNMTGDFNVTDNFAIDEKGLMIASAGSWVLAYDTQTDPLDQLTGAKETETTLQQDNSIKLEEENVVIGGVKVKRNRIEQ